MAQQDSRPDEHAHALRRSVILSLGQGDFARAEEELGALKEAAPLWVDTRGLELEILVKSARLDEARALAPQLLSLFPGSAKIQYLAGLLHYKTRQYADARACFEESGRLHPHWSTSRYLAKTLSQMHGSGRLDEAEAILVPLLRDHPDCLLDLSWVYQRRNEIERAIEATERYLEARPGSQYGKERLQALRAKLLDASDVQAEVEMHLELGEPVPEDMLASYFESLLRTGQMKKARDFFSAHGPSVNERTATRIAWAAYKLKAYDLAVDWFLACLDRNRDDGKYFSALEKAAELSARAEEVIRAYRQRIPDDKRFFGRVARLERKVREAADGEK